MITALEQVKNIIETNQLKNENFKHFVLQGGAGSGKTESLKEIIKFISGKYPSAKIACITHTNVAVEEIKKRAGQKYDISTVHSFLNLLIKNNKKNIKDVLQHIFCISEDVIHNHDQFKKIHEKYSKKNFTLNKILSEKVIGKRDYDKAPNESNNALLHKVKLLNQQIVELISTKEYTSIEYNDSKFDSLEKLTFSHDSLITIAYKLCDKHELLCKIISDKYDFVFIDEYQDTSPLVIKIFLKLLPKNMKTTIGLFGDSMQGIYDDGVGDVEDLINEGILLKVDKNDNYRCSNAVIKFINQLRNDSIEQKLALKDGEVTENRTGTAKLYYKVVNKKPTTFSPPSEKQKYVDELNLFINEVKIKLDSKNTKLLMLTNKSISSELEFPNLYNIFNDRFTDVKDEIEKELAKIQIVEIIEICNFYHLKNYNQLIVQLKKNGFTIKTVNDKEKIISCLDTLCEGNLSVSEALQFCYENKLVKKSDRAISYEMNKNNFVQEYYLNTQYLFWEKLFLKDINTVAKLKKEKDLEISQEQYDNFLYDYKKKTFFEKLFSDTLCLKEIFNYYNYLNENSNYITMHKTKGIGIDNVILVLDEYFWNKYNFRHIYDTSAEHDKRIKNQKLFYVACSRAIKDLAVVRFVEDEVEEQMLLNYFKNCEVEKITA